MMILKRMSLGSQPSLEAIAADKLIDCTGGDQLVTAYYLPAGMAHEHKAVVIFHTVAARYSSNPTLTDPNEQNIFLEVSESDLMALVDNLRSGSSETDIML
jgi:hypothetical protein